MPHVIGEITVSIDGYVTGPNPGPQNGLGDGGVPLHNWAVASDDPVDQAVLHQATENTGAVVMGRRLFDIVDGPHGWSEDMGYGAAEAAAPPFFVVTHAEPAHVRLDLDFTFVTDGLAEAVEQARRAAGAQDVVVMGGAQVIRDCLEHGHLDELRLHVAPLVLGGGTPLFLGATRRELVQREVRPSSHATHITYGVSG